MKIYAVFAQDIESAELQCIFSTREKADNFINNYPACKWIKKEDLFIEEHEVDTED